MAGGGVAHLREGQKSLLRVEDLVVEYKLKNGARVQAVSGVSFDIRDGETFSVVGESGCGKSTLARAVMQLVPSESGQVLLDGERISGLKASAMRKYRGRIQMIFQDPISSLNPRRTIRKIVAEGLDIQKRGGAEERRAVVERVMDEVGLDPAIAGDRRPSELSGGQCQRVSIARALATDPELIVCDEPVSALDVSVQAQVLNLLEDTKERHNLTLLFIAHDLAVVKSISDRVGVMYLGKLCEIGDSDEVYAAPLHPYTAALLASIPDPTQTGVTETELSGDIPSPLDPPSGCRFRTRCPIATERCAQEEPAMRELRPGQFVACHYPLS